MPHGDDNFMPDQISVRLIDATGSEEEGWNIHWLTPCTCIDPILEDASGLHHAYYLQRLTSKLPWLANLTLFIQWDEYNSYGQVFGNGKPILELVGEIVG